MTSINAVETSATETGVAAAPRKEYASIAYRAGAFLIDITACAAMSLLAGVTGSGPDDVLPGIISITSNWIYFAASESSAWQATLGKKAFGIKVEDVGGNRISFLRATGRHFAKALSAGAFLLGFLLVFFTEKKQALHDKIAGTVVVIP